MEESKLKLGLSKIWTTNIALAAVLVPFIMGIYSPLAYAEGSSSAAPVESSGGTREEIDNATAAAKAEINALRNTDAKVPAFDDTQSQVFLFVRSGKFDDATKLVNDALAGVKDSEQQTNLLYLLSAVESLSGKPDAAIAHLQTVFKAQPVAKTEADHVKRALILKRIGDCYYASRNTKDALPNYLDALAECASLPPNHPLNAAILEAISGSYVYNNKFAEAEPFAKRQLDVMLERAKGGKLPEVASLFWARIQLMNVYRHTNNEEGRKKLVDATDELMNRILTVRAQLDAEDKLPEIEKMKMDFEDYYIGEFQPTTPAEYLWLASEFKMKSLPLIQWAPKNQTAKAAILCIHGLGLENRSFTNFGHEMAAKGYSVYALDVRGFGAWLNEQGQEDVHFADTVKDIGVVLNVIKKRETVPVFLLGESMGGAIALRGAAAYGNLIAGVISSVPSAEIFQQRRMGMSVAFHLLQGSNKPFRVGDMVTQQATKNTALADQWKSDYKAKMNMSPKELIKFAVFMRSTKNECENIKTVPAFLIQGLKDRLVKPQGTFELFDAIASEDKDLLILGTAEHLIFETLDPSNPVIDTVCTWLEEHITPRAKAEK